MSTTAGSPPGTAELEQVDRALARVLGRGRWILAVSGGADSMTLLHAAARNVPGAIAAVAVFDHATGPHARAAVRMVRRVCATLGVRCISERATPGDTTEAAWRRARWTFLHATARALDAQVATAHTRDDQIETVCIRILRGSGARGLAGLYASGAGARPLVELPRALVREAGARLGACWLEDPSNASRTHLRNRLRLDLLPAMRRVRPDFDEWMLDLAGRAARVRQRTDDCAAQLSERNGIDRVSVARDKLIGYDEAELLHLWPAIAALAGVVLDRRGTARLAAFTMTGRTGTRIQLSGGFEVVRTRGAIVIGRDDHPAGSRHGV